MLTPLRQTLFDVQKGANEARAGVPFEIGAEVIGGVPPTGAFDEAAPEDRTRPGHAQEPADHVNERIVGGSHLQEELAFLVNDIVVRIDEHDIGVRA